MRGVLACWKSRLYFSPSISGDQFMERNMEWVAIGKLNIFINKILRKISWPFKLCGRSKFKLDTNLVKFWFCRQIS